MPQRLTRNQIYFQCLKMYERKMAQQLAPFKTGKALGEPAIEMFMKEALRAIPQRDRAFFIKERAERKDRFPTF